MPKLASLAPPCASATVAATPRDKACQGDPARPSNGSSRAGSCPTRRPARSWPQRVDAIAAGTARELVWLLEHPPLYTAGTSARAGDLLDAGALSGAPHRARRPVHLSRARTARRLCHARRRRAASATCAPTSRRWRRWIIDALGAAGRARARRSTAASASGCGGRSRATGRPRQDRRHRRAAAPLGELARLQRQRRARPRALLRHRALRHRATPG